MKKFLLLTSVALSSVASMTVASTAFAAGNDKAGYCTREYDPVPYVTKSGKKITAPNACVANHWKVQGR